MFDIFLIILNLALAGLAGYNVFWQSQIQLRASYSYGQVLIGVGLAVWITTAGLTSWMYVIFVALFVLLYIMSGVTGLGSKRLVSQGWFSRALKYTNVAEVALTPINAPGGKNIVVAVFTFKPRRRVQLMFRQPLEVVLGALKRVVPDNTPLTIQKIN